MRPSPAPWPAYLPPPLELLAWLNAQVRQHRHDAAMLRCLSGLRWLVLAELDATPPHTP